ncbi:MAG: OmpA family protein [Bacteroides sp.]|nr:OmpA family protein [Bacteroides sp.]
MKIMRKFTVGLLAATMLIGTGCSSLTKTGKGALIGTGGGGALGAGIGALIGGGKGAGIGAAIGAAVGAGAGALIGQKMDKQQKELEKELADQAKVEQVTDSNGLQAIKLTFDGGILFPTGKYDLNPSAQADLTKFAVSLLNNPDTDVAITGYTDDTGTYAVNEKLSNQRANSVRNYLINCGVAPDRLSAKGIPMADYIASNDTPEGRALNRRVEITVYANEKMIKEAEAQSQQTAWLY